MEAELKDLNKQNIKKIDKPFIDGKVKYFF